MRLNRITTGRFLGKQEAMRHTLLLSVLSALLLVGPLAPSASAGPQDLQELLKTNVSANLKAVPLRLALRLLVASNKGAALVVDPNVPDVTIEATIKHRPFLEALHQVVRLASSEKTRVEFGITLDAIIVRVNPNTPEEEKANPGARRKVLLSLKEIPLRRALDMIFMGSGLQYSVNPIVPNLPVTLELKSVPIEQALPMLVEALAKQVQLGITLEQDVYVVRVVQ
jgi:hypothetical protein